MSTKVITPIESLATGSITKHIVVMRHHKVLRDTDFAELYSVLTTVLVQAVKRNGGSLPHRFHVSARYRRAGNLEVTICDLKIATWRPALSALYLH